MHTHGCSAINNLDEYMLTNIVSILSIVQTLSLKYSNDPFAGFDLLLSEWIS
jgi:hypothetical protein